MFEFPPDVDKDFILSRISEEEIFEMYGVNVTNMLFKSTLRTDKHATCKFYRRNNGKLILHDYSGDFWGDCFDLVMRKTGKKYHQALEDIARRFRLISDGGVIVDLDRIPLPPKVIIEPDACKIRVKRRAWTREDLAFWEIIGVSRSTLELYDVYPLDRAWMNDEPIFWYGAHKEMAFLYHFKDYGQFEYKLYFPFREERRFIHSNGGILQGFHQLPQEGEVLVVTKSYKDVISLYEFGIPACSPMAETMIVSPNDAEVLMKRFKHIFCLYDVDRLTGVVSMRKMRDNYGWQPIFFNVRKNQPKDFTEFVEKYGVGDTRLLINYVRDIYL